jgi:hypothetical protein
MARAWRIEFEGALYHVLSRGNERRDIFFGGDDRRLFLDALGDMAQRFGIDVFAYVLMGNHYNVGIGQIVIARELSMGHDLSPGRLLPRCKGRHVRRFQYLGVPRENPIHR